ncbi:uncharacterized protein LOC114313361 [Camellia sinensis]|uniref:uncharacterized protein LOC114313361 n=1 Tax=Camellia sinensis TaxID=4442 RepID=UPI001036B3C2|nr:uncharacterized protein LOC114313361 [Camellia sinensis]
MESKLRQAEENLHAIDLIAESRDLDEVKGRRRREEPAEVKQVVYDHFRLSFSEYWKYRPKLLGPFNVIAQSQHFYCLDVEFSKHEIWAAVAGCDGNKAPGSNGFYTTCYQKGWKFMKTDIITFVKEFFANSSLVGGLNSSFITLVPKKDDPIGNAQAAFLGGRNILGGILIANKVVDWWKKSRRKGLALKLDFQKVYDTVNWNYLFQMLSNFGFSAKWVNWICSCLSLAKISMLVNGSPTLEFFPQKGLKQSDPLSPLLFNVLAEGLNLLLARAKGLGLIKGVIIGSNAINISHLQFADNTIIFCEAEWSEVLTVKRILRCFEDLG